MYKVVLVQLVEDLIMQDLQFMERVVVIFGLDK